MYDLSNNVARYRFGALNCDEFPKSEIQRTRQSHCGGRRYFSEGTHSPPKESIKSIYFFSLQTLSQQFLYSMNFWLLICPEWLCFDWSFGSIELVKTWLDVRVLAIFAFNVRLLHIILNGSRLISHPTWINFVWFWLMNPMPFINFAEMSWLRPPL